MLDAVLFLPSEGVHRFDCVLGLKNETVASCRLECCFKRRIEKKKNSFCFLFLFVRMELKKERKTLFFWCGSSVYVQ